MNKVPLPSWTAVIALILACTCGGNTVLPTASLSSSPFATLSVTQSPTASPEAEYMDQSPNNALFPIGFMGVQNEQAFPQIATGGFNIVHEFRSVQGISAAADYLTLADAVGLQVIQNLPDCRAYAASQPYCEGVEIWSEGEWAEFISTLAAHDNLVAWFLPDEITDYDAAANLYEWAHTYDPRDRPVFGNPGTYQQSIINLFPAFTDFLWVACYPEYDDLPRAIVTYAMQRDASACAGTDTRWGAILQFFDSADFGGSGGHPTAHQIRCDSYQAIIGGATGLWYFNYLLGQDLAELLAGIEIVADEIIGTGGLDEVILAPDVPQTITKRVISGPTQSPVVQGEIYDSIQTLQKEYGSTYLFAVNIATDTVTVEFGNLPAGTEEIEVLFEGRTIPITNSSFSDAFAQNDVHIYRVVDGTIFLPLVIKLSP